MLLRRNRLHELRSKLLADTEHRVKALMDMEDKQTWTQNDHYMVTSTKAFLERLLMEHYNTDDVAELERLKIDPAVKIDPADHKLLELIAGTLAYFKVSAMDRFASACSAQCKWLLI